MTITEFKNSLETAIRNEDIEAVYALDSDLMHGGVHGESDSLELDPQAKIELIHKINEAIEKFDPEY